MIFRTSLWSRCCFLPIALLHPSNPQLSPRPSLLPPQKQLRCLGTRLRMSNGDADERSDDPKVNTHVANVQGTIKSSPTDGWGKCWEQGVTPWDLGGPTPVILDLLQTGTLPKGRALIPGCGSGHDVIAIAGPDRYVVGLDISETAVKKARESSSALPNADYFTFLKEDFFNWHPSQLFDLIFDYTFFCAIEPDLRPAWAKQVCDLLKPDGELITLMFPIDDHVGGPPYKVSVADYKELLQPLGFEAFYIEDNNLAIKPRKGREKLGRWKRSLNQSVPFVIKDQIN